jgi:hypothetical protein
MHTYVAIPSSIILTPTRAGGHGAPAVRAASPGACSVSAVAPPATGLPASSLVEATGGQSAAGSGGPPSHRGLAEPLAEAHEHEEVRRVQPSPVQEAFCLSW